MEGQDAEYHWLLYMQTHPGIVDKLFSGLLETTVTCERCKNQSVTYAPFFDCALACRKTLEASIQDFIAPTVLEQRDAYHCERCNKKSRALVTMGFARLPSYVILSMKRFRFPEMTKIKGRVTYQEYMDFSQVQISAKEENLYELFAVTVHMGSLE